MKGVLAGLLCILLLPATVQAATVQGTVYDLYLDRVQNAVVEIDGQQMVSQDGTYSFVIGPGEYTVSAKEMDQGTVISDAEKDVTVGEGKYTVDLILFPTYQEEESILNETMYMEPDITLEEEGFSLWILAGVAGVIVLFVLILWKIRELAPLNVTTLPSDLEHVVKLIKKSGGRMTQKELRKELGLSAAKISLMVTDLEDRGIIKKIKKGRGNVLILKE